MGLRVAFYTRVSTEEQLAGYSIDAQTRACRDYAESKGWSVVREYCDEGRSARVEDIAKRPGFQRLMAEAQEKAFDVVLVHKIDRFSRNRKVAFDCFDKLGRAGLSFVSISENMDFSAPWGQFALTMLVGLAQLFSDNLSHETKKGKAERKRQGLYNGLLPFGAARGEDRVPVPDRAPLNDGSTNYDGLLLAFRSAAEGKTDAQIARLLNAGGWRTTGNRGQNLWRKDSVRRLLVNRFYLGDLPVLEQQPGHKKPVLVGWVPGKHEAFIDPELFEAAQEARQANRSIQRSLSVSNGSRTYSLSGLLRCGHCLESDDPRRGAMRIQLQHSDQARTLCYSRTQGLGCPQRSTFLYVYERQVEDWLQGIALPEDAVDQALAKLRAEAKMVEDAGAERRKLEGRLKRIKELYSWGDLGRTEYLAERDEIRRRLEVLEPEKKQRKDMQHLAEMARGSHALWLAAGAEGGAARNKVLTRLLTAVVVKDDRVVEIHPRPEIALFVTPWKASSYPGGSDGIRTRDLSLDRAAC